MSMRFSELKGRAVVDLEDAKKIGEVDDLLIEPVTHHTIGLVVKSGGLFGQGESIPLSQVNRVGPDAIMVTQQSPEGQAKAINSDKNAATLTDILNNKVVTDAGTLVGHISDVIIDPNSLEITGYDFKADGLFAKPHEFPVSPQLRYGEKLVTVPESLLHRSA